MKRILITGSREHEDRDLIHSILVQHGPGIVVHGAARGADTIAGEIAEELGWPVERHPALWNKHGKAAGHIRNQEMVSAGADICLAFPIGDSRGTRDCMRRAKEAGIPVVETEKM